MHVEAVQRKTAASRPNTCIRPMLAGMAITQASDRPFSRSRLIMWAGSAAVTRHHDAPRTRRSAGTACCAILGEGCARLPPWPWGCDPPGCVRSITAHAGRAHQQVNGRQHPQRVAPAQRVNQPGRQRDEHRAGQPAQKGHGDDGAAKVMREAARHHRKHRAYSVADSPPPAASTPHRTRPGCRPCCAAADTMRHQQRAARHHRALMPAVDPAAHRVGQQPFGQQARLKASDDCARPNPARAPPAPSAARKV
jgi:hypothetical protein